MPRPLSKLKTAGRCDLKELGGVGRQKQALQAIKDRGFWGWRDRVAVRELALPVAELGSFPRIPNDLLSPPSPGSDSLGQKEVLSTRYDQNQNSN